jgi:hypothetical protein
MPEIILISIGVYLLYRLVFDLLVPVYKTTQHVKQKFRDINPDSHGENGQGFRKSSAQGQPGANKKKPGVGEYIDFEEIK